MRYAVVSVLDEDLRDELARAEEEHERMLAAAGAARGRAAELIEQRPFDRPFEHLEAELEAEYAERVRYHRAKLGKKIPVAAGGVGRQAGRGEREIAPPERGGAFTSDGRRSRA